MARRTDQIPADTKAWIKEGRSDIALWALRGLGIKLHSAQIEFAEAVLRGEAGYYLLTWANRAGKTTVLIVLHMHRLFYKLGIEPPTTEAEERMWQNEEYRTLHCAPLGELAGRAWLAIGDIINGTSKCQRDEDGKRRPAPLAQMFAATKERTESNADRMFLRCLTGAVTDFRSTEGKAARIEGGIRYHLQEEIIGDPEAARAHLASLGFDIPAPRRPEPGMPALWDDLPTQ